MRDLGHVEGECVECDTNRARRIQQHPWLDDLRVLAQVIGGTFYPPHAEIPCDDCDRARELMRRGAAERGEWLFAKSHGGSRTA